METLISQLLQLHASCLWGKKKDWTGREGYSVITNIKGIYIFFLANGKTLFPAKSGDNVIYPINI